MNQVRGKRIGMVFQDPSGSLDPTYSVGNQLCEPLRLHRGLSRREARREAVDLLDRVRVPRATETMSLYPHQLSGGQRQRVMIAIALACRPDLLIADEPTTSLDVTVQERILDLLFELQKDMGLSILFVTHDLGVVADICDRVVVMYSGQVVETADVEQLFARPTHPYSDALLQALPRLEGRRLFHIAGRVPPPERWADTSCRFAARCEHAAPVCMTRMPELSRTTGGSVRCARTQELLEQVRP